MVSTVVGSASIRIIPDTSGFSAALRGQLNSVTSSLGAMGGRNITGGLSTQLNTLATNLDRVGTRSVLVGQSLTYGLTVPIARAGRAIVGVSADFDHAARVIGAITTPVEEATASVEAGMDMFEDRVDGFKTVARELARDSVFTSTEMAEGMVDLGRAGLETAEQLTAVLPTIANVALVEGEAVSAFSDKLINVFLGFGGALDQFGPDVKTIFGEVRSDVDALGAEFEHMGDIISLVSQRTTTDIDGLAIAFRYAGPVANAMGLSFEETAAALGTLAQAGFDASLGGTALRGILVRLAIPTQINEEIFKKFGISQENAFAPENAVAFTQAIVEMGGTAEDAAAILAEGKEGFDELSAAVKDSGLEIFDASGKMIPLLDILTHLRDSGARGGDLMKVFAQRAGPASLALIENLEAFEGLIAATEGAEGALDTMANRVMTSATSQFRLLKKSFVELAITLGESGLLEFFVDISKGLRDVVMGMADGNPQMLKFVGVVASLIALIGPLNLLFGVYAKAFASVLKVMAFALTPFGAVATSIGLVVAGVGLLATQSEGLRSALGGLFQAIQITLGPILEQAVRLFAILQGGVGDVAGAIGDALAPVIVDAAQAMSNWVGDADGLQAFLSKMVDTVGDLAINAILLWEQFRDSAALDALGDGVSRVADDVMQLVDVLWPIVNNLLPALAGLAPSVAGTVAAAFVVAWKAAGVFLTAIEAILDVLGPVVSFMADNLEPILGLLAVRFLLLRRNAFLSVTGLSRVQTAMSNAAIRTGIFSESVGNAAVRLTTGLARGLNAVGTQMPIIGERTQRLSLHLQQLANRSVRVGATLQRFTIKAGNAFLVMGQIATIAIQNISLFMGAFLSGQMAAQAEDLTSKVTALGGALSSMVVGYLAAGGGPQGMAVAGLIGITAAIGNFVSKQKDLKDSLIDTDKAVEALTETMSENDSAYISSTDALGDFAAVLDEMAPGNFDRILDDIEELGFDVDDLGLALAGGSRTAERFAESLTDEFVQAIVTGSEEVGNLNVKVSELSGRQNLFSGISVPFEDLADELERSEGSIGRLFSGDKVLGDFRTIEELVGLLAEHVQEFAHIDAILDFANDVDLARERFESTNRVMQIVEAEQGRIADKARTWAERTDEVNQALDVAKRRIRGLFEPADNVATEMGDISAQIDEMMETAKEEGLTLFQELSPTDPRYQRWQQSHASLLGETGDLIGALAAELPPFLPDDQREVALFDAVNAKREEFFQAFTTDWGLSAGEANRILDELLTKPLQALSEEELNIALGIDDSEVRNFRLDQAMASGELSALDVELVMSMQAHGALNDLGSLTSFIDMITGAEGAEAGANLQIMLNALTGEMDLPEGMTEVSFASMLERVGLGPMELDTFMEIRPTLSGYDRLSDSQKDILAGVFARDGIPDALTANADLLVNLTHSPTGSWFGHAAGTIIDLLEGNVIEGTEIHTLVSLAEGDLPDNWDIDRIGRLLSGGTVSTAQVETLMRIIPRLPDIPNVSTQQEAHLARLMLSGGETENEIAARFSLLASDPEKFDEILALFSSTEGAPAKIVGDVDLITEFPEVDPAILEFAKGWGGSLFPGSTPSPALDGLDEIQTKAEETSGVVHTQTEQMLQSYLDLAEGLGPVAEASAESINAGFSKPLGNSMTNWSNFARTVNAAAVALGMGNIIPESGIIAPLGFPMFHSGGVVGERTGDSYDGSRPLRSDEMFALLQRGEGVMTEQMMANMTSAQISAFKRGDQRWWAVGDAFERGHSLGTKAVGDSGVWGVGSLNKDALAAAHATFVGNMAAMRSTYNNGASARMGSGSVERIGGGAMDLMRGASEAIGDARAKYLTSIGLPAGFNLSGMFPSGFDVSSWRSFLGANAGRPGNYPLLISYLKAAGVPFLVNSTVRPGAMTVSGNLSNHALGRAVDFGAPGDRNYDSPGLLKINRAFAPMLGVLSELIYSGPGAITDKAYGAAVMAAHHNHVHVALKNGAIIRDLVYAMLGEAGPEVVIPLNDPARALDLAQASGLMKVLASAQSGQTGRSALSTSRRTPSTPAGSDDGILGGTGNTYHLHGISWEDARRKIENRDRAVLRRRR